MHRRRLNTLTALLGAVSTAALAGCSREPGVEPRIVSLSLVSGSGQSGFVGALLTQPLVVRAADQDGVPVSGVQVNWVVVSGGGVATPPESITDGEGLTAATFRLGAALGQQTVSASMPGGQPVTFLANATAAPASQIEIVSGDNQTGVVQANLPADLTVKVTDAFGNAKEGVPIFFAVVLGNGTLSNANPVSDAQGTARVRWTLGPLAGTQRVTAQIPGALPAIFDATATPAAAARVVIVSGNNQVAAPGATLPDSIVARVTDIYENPVKDVNVTWAPVGNAGTVSPPTGKTDAVGRIAAKWTLGPLGGPKEMRATVSGLPPASFQAAGTIVFAAVMAGGSHTCAVDTDRLAYCWGLNDAGQLGKGTAVTGINPANLSPGLVNSSQAFTGGSSGSSHSCAVTQSNIAYCWGLNPDGRVGNGGQTSVSSPATVIGGHSFRTLSAGDTHTCGITVGDRLFCWGSNAEGKLGIGGTASSASPVAVAPFLAFASVASGRLHTCGAATNGALYCWGNNALGQAGLGPIAGPDVPTQVPGSSFDEVVAGANHTCARQGTDVLCWGANESGQLGDGTNDAHDFPSPLPPTGIGFASLTAGNNHTCGLDEAGRAYCWGLGTSGQLGNDSFTSSNQPVSVALGITFLMLSAGGNHTCGVSTGNVLYCWGENGDGALGDGTQVNSPLPVRVAFQP